MMKNFSNELSYDIMSDGYEIYLNGNKWIIQHEPYIPFPELSYEENAVKQCEELDEEVNPVKILAKSKKEKISQTHEKLDEFLEENYVEIEMKGSIQKYSVTKEKQNLLAALIQRKEYCETNNIEFDALWNVRGEKAEVYTLEELQKISVAIYEYVQRYIAKQQELEDAINACKTLEELAKIRIVYEEK